MNGVTRRLAALLAAFIAPFATACPPAPPPFLAPPDGATATKAEMLAYVARWKEYDSAVLRTLECLHREVRQDCGLDMDCLERAQQASRDFDALLARQIAEGERANVQIRRFQQR